MIYISTIFLLLTFLTSNAQNFASVYTSSYWSRKDVEKDLDQEFEKGRLNKSILYSSKSESKDTLVYQLQDTIIGFTLKTTFNIKDSVDIYCDFQQFIFDCTPCSQKALPIFIGECDFIKESENVYLSNKAYRTKMTVEYKSGNKNCLVITFRHIALSKKEYKVIYKNLKKKTTA